MSGTSLSHFRYITDISDTCPRQLTDFRDICQTLWIYVRYIRHPCKQPVPCPTQLPFLVLQPLVWDCCMQTAVWDCSMQTAVWDCCRHLPQRLRLQTHIWDSWPFDNTAIWDCRHLSFTFIFYHLIKFPPNYQIQNTNSYLSISSLKHT
jgi:hypothetical protein